MCVPNAANYDDYKKEVKISAKLIVK